jgi:hypothetical protein
MNEDDFEKKLRALTGAFQRPDPTPAWKADILARARREARAIPMQRTLPPRWLMLSWAAAWVAVFVLNFTAPSEPQALMARTMPDPDAGSAPTAYTQAAASPQTLLALEQRMKLNLDLP